MTKQSVAIPSLENGTANQFGDIVVFTDKRGWVYKYLLNGGEISGVTTASRTKDVVHQMSFTAHAENRFRKYNGLRATLIGNCLIYYTDDDSFDMTDAGHVAVRAAEIRRIPYASIFASLPDIDLILVPQLGVKKFRNVEPVTPTAFQEITVDPEPKNGIPPEIQDLLNVRNFRLEAGEEDNGTFVFEGVCVRQAEQITEYESGHVRLTTDQSLKSDRILRFSNLFGDVIVQAETDKPGDCDIFVVEGPQDLITMFQKSDFFFVAVMRTFVSAAEAMPGYRCILILPNARESIVVEWGGRDFGFTSNGIYVDVPDIPKGSAKEACDRCAMNAFFGLSVETASLME